MKQYVRLALIAGVYVALTVALAPISYGMIQVRISEALMLLCCFSPKYGIALTVGCALANLFGGYGLIDIVIGTLATALAAVCMGKTKPLFLSSLWAVGWNALLVGGELAYLTQTPFWINALSVAAGEFISVSLFGYTIFTILSKTRWIHHLK